MCYSCHFSLFINLIHSLYPYELLDIYFVGAVNQYYHFVVQIVPALVIRNSFRLAPVFFSLVAFSFFLNFPTLALLDS